MHPLRNIINEKALLTSIAEKHGTPVYVYDFDQINKNINKLRLVLDKNFKKSHVCYAIKANSNPNLLREMRSIFPKIGGDCSSPGEILAAELSGIDLSSCIYTGNYESVSDLQNALEKGCNINLDDETSLERLKTIGLPKRVSFRLNPGFGKGTYSQITTAGEKAKFGIPSEKIVEAYRKAQNAGIKRFGLQCMAGSGNLDEKYFSEILTAILKHAKRIESELNIKFEYISMGGGFGVPYKNEDTPLNYENLFSSLAKVLYDAYPDKDTAPEFWIEPGKSIIANAGFILTRVTGIKSSYRNFIGIDAGMETLMRPALYGAYHRIYKVGEHNGSETTVDFTGQICENTDRIATDRSFPALEEGELVAIMDAGAYGYSMSHNFNTRPRAAEVLLKEKSYNLIRRRETINDIFSHTNV